MKVLITDPIHEAGIKRLRKFAEVEIYTDLNHEELIDKVPEFDAIIVRSSTKIGEDVLNAAENLKLVVRAGVGLDNIDLDCAEEKGVKVENTPEASTIAVAELTLGLMLSWSRSIPQADKSLKEGKWMKSRFKGVELREKTLGIIGTGRIGMEVAKRAKAFQMSLMGHDILKRDEFNELGGEYVNLKTLLKKSDYVTLHIPLNQSTEHLIGEDELKLMDESAVLVNTSRGAVVNEEALIKSLREEEIAGACLDIYEKNPIEDGRLLKLPNTVLTPHIGASSKEAQKAVGIEAAEKVKKNLG